MILELIDPITGPAVAMTIVIILISLAVGLSIHTLKS